MCAHYVILIPPCVPDLSNIYSPITIFSLFCENFWVASLGFDPEAKTLEGQKLDRTSRKYKLLLPPIPHLKKCLKNCFFKDHKFRQYSSQNVCFQKISRPPQWREFSKKKYLPAPVSLEIVFLPLKGFKS